MSGENTVPEAWKARIDALVDAGERDRAIELLKMWITQHALTPWVMERLGLLLLASGRIEEAGRPLFWSGRRDSGQVAEAVARFLRHKRGKPRRLAETLPRRACGPLESFPPALRAELVELGVTEHMLQRFTDARSVPDVVVWAIGLACLGVFATGLFVCVRFAWGWLSSLWA
jgi:hypothetical protein